MSQGESAELDQLALRNALGTFATGVTIVSTHASSGQDIGVTANSFNSVSLNPPMVLWSLSRKAMSLSAFQTNPYFAVHVLAADQDGLSRRFAKQGADKFSGIEVGRGYGDVPLIDGCAARFQCRTAFNYDGGDHVIFVGEVLAFDSFQRAPLLFHAGRYALAVEKTIDATGSHRAIGDSSGEAEHEFLFGLLGRAHNLMYQQIQAELGKWSLSDSDRSGLSQLGTGNSAESSEAIRHLVDATRSAERLSCAKLGPDELQQLKTLLQKLSGQSR